MFKIVANFASENMGKKGDFLVWTGQNYYIARRGVLRKV